MKRLKNMLLVYPAVPAGTYWSFHYALTFIRKRSAMPPLGLLTVAALFPDDCSIRLVDMNIEPLEDADIRWADMVFVSAMIVQKESMRQVIAACNRLNTPVAAGGPYPTGSWREIEGVDCFVLGEPDETFGQVLADLDAGTARKVYEPPPRPDMAAAVLPRFDLLRMDAYGSMAVQYSRGCPFKCEFCDIWKTYGNRPRLKRTERMIAEIDALYRLGWRGAVFIVDDNFIGNKRRVRQELLPALRRWQMEHEYPFNFFTEASVNLAADHVLLAGMRDAGFSEVFIGIETPSCDALKETGKTQNIAADLPQVVSVIQGFGIGVMAGFILGFDSDGEDIFDRMIAFIQHAGIPQAMVGLLAALPDTELEKRLKREGRLLDASDGNNTHHMTTNFVTRMDPDTLKAGYGKVLNAIYDGNLANYFTRCNTMLDRLGENVHFRRRIHPAEIRMLLKSLTRQPFTRYGAQYLKFVARNAIRNTSRFSEVIRYAIIGHHFHTITQQTLKTDRVAADLETIYRDFREQIGGLADVMVENPRPLVQQVLESWQQRVRLLEDIRIKIDRLHEDFREDLRNRYAEIALAMKERIRSLTDMAASRDPGVSAS